MSVVRALNNMSATVLTKSDLAFNRYSGFIPMLPSEWAVFPTMELLYQLSYIGSKSINKFLNFLLRYITVKTPYWLFFL